MMIAVVLLRSKKASHLYRDPSKREKIPYPALLVVLAAVEIYVKLYRFRFFSWHFEEINTIESCATVCKEISIICPIDFAGPLHLFTYHLLDLTLRSFVNLGQSDGFLLAKVMVIR